MGAAPQITPSQLGARPRRPYLWPALALALALSVAWWLLRARLSPPPSTPDEIRAALRREPGRKELYPRLAAAFRERGQLPEAAQALLGGLELDGSNPGLLQELGEIHLELGRLGEAEAALRRSLKLDARRAGPRLALGRLLGTRRQYQAAVDTLREEAALAPRDAAVRYELGMAQSRQELWKEAEAEFRGALLANPRHAASHTGLGQALAHQGDAESASVAFAQAQALAPREPSVWHASGYHALQARSGAESAQEAIRCLTRALELGGENPQTLYLLGSAYQQAGRREQARAALERSLTLDPGFRSSVFALIQVHRALGQSTTELSGRFQRLLSLQSREEQIRRRMAVSPPTAADYFALAGLLREQGRLPQAIAELEQGLGRAPRDRARHAELATLLELTGRLEEAARERSIAGSAAGSGAEASPAPRAAP